MARILSGIRPTGELHIGNFLGSLAQWADLSRVGDNDCYFAIVDYHALLSHRDTPLNTASLDLAAWVLAAGVDPKRVTLFLQSAVPAHTELAWIVNSLVTVAEISRMTQYKDLVSQGTEQPTSALLTYPLLQAADILLYKAETVPVGEDQVQHIELARTLAERINRIAQTDCLPAPRPRLTSSARIMSLNDPTKKMAKSLPQGAILLTDDPDTIRHKIARAVTDSDQVGQFADTALANLALDEGQRARLFETMTPGVKNLFAILYAVASQDIADTLLRKYAHKTLLYRELKETLADAVLTFVAPLQAKYRAVRPDETALKTVLAEGTAKARAVAEATLAEIKHHFQILSL